ncbi:uncharacterized protein LOC115938083 isoform X1 [Leptonychotes weddellii]|uniref:Uncharacterized protein LOC115938083 isoform X1 n=1 Tax=Leptonychotes weddellii TaxID=9713 RepID=A0A7F8Q9X6_LEPWE|nr:uncharacterized protein LOC115938083 isoform X1 [Leptonychotes weddellii]
MVTLSPLPFSGSCATRPAQLIPWSPCVFQNMTHPRAPPRKRDLSWPSGGIPGPQSPGLTPSSCLLVLQVTPATLPPSAGGPCPSTAASELLFSKNTIPTEPGRPWRTGKPEHLCCHLAEEKGVWMEEERSAQSRSAPQGLACPWGSSPGAPAALGLTLPQGPFGASSPGGSPFSLPSREPASNAALMHPGHLSSTRDAARRKAGCSNLRPATCRPCDPAKAMLPLRALVCSRLRWVDRSTRLRGPQEGGGRGDADPG